MIVGVYFYFGNGQMYLDRNDSPPGSADLVKGELPLLLAQGFFEWSGRHTVN
jgi:hypothetical protein